MIDKDLELCALLLRIASPITHDDAAIAQISQAAEVVHNVRLGTCASISAAVGTYPGFPNVNEELMAQAKRRPCTSHTFWSVLIRARRRSGRSPVDNHPSPTLTVRCSAALEVPPIRMGGCGRCTDPGLETTGSS